MTPDHSECDHFYCLKSEPARRDIGWSVSMSTGMGGFT
jgi:hypothetical protein